MHANFYLSSDRIDLNMDPGLVVEANTVDLSKKSSSKVHAMNKSIDR